MVSLVLNLISSMLQSLKRLTKNKKPQTFHHTYLLQQSYEVILGMFSDSLLSGCVIRSTSPACLIYTESV